MNTGEIVDGNSVDRRGISYQRDNVERYWDIRARERESSLLKDVRCDEEDCSSISAWVKVVSTAREVRTYESYYY
jgi:hypothetical protein